MSCAARGGVKKAVLSYEIPREAEGLSLARVRLQTGRTHQIRVQFASRGFPLLGDGKYGSRDNRCTCASGPSVSPSRLAPAPRPSKPSRPTNTPDPIPLPAISKGSPRSIPLIGGIGP
ncbi:MAG: hypothetical protein ACLU3I_00395 [Acutalibacteraceae bacterium]